MAPKACISVALLVRRFAIAVQGGGIQNDELPEWDWYDICAHLKCTECGSVGWVDPRPNWSDVIDFNKGIGSRPTEASR